MVLSALIWLLTAVTAGLFVVKRWWFPAAISEHARLFDSQFSYTLAVMGGVFVAAQAALGWVILRGRHRARAEYSEGNTKLEVIWTATTAALFLGVVALSTGVFAGVHIEKPPADALQVEAIGKQFAWNFRYPGVDGKYGTLDVRQINDASGNPFGIDEKDVAGKDDVVSAALRVPAGRDVVVTLRARDVIHNFFVRELRLKQDLVPGMAIPLHFRADTPGTYEVACSELCGLGHHLMKTSLVVMPPEEFETWLRQMDEQLKGQQ